MENNVFNELPLLLTVPRAAQLLGISRAATYRLVASGELPAAPTGRSRIHPYRRTPRSSGIVNDFVYQCASQWYSSLGPRKIRLLANIPGSPRTGSAQRRKLGKRAGRRCGRQTDRTSGVACHRTVIEFFDEWFSGIEANHHSTQPPGRTGRTTPTPTSCLASANTLQRFHEPQLLSLDTTLLAEGHIMCNRDTEMLSATGTSRIAKARKLNTAQPKIPAPLEPM